MTDKYPVIRLGEVLRLEIDAVPVDASTSYPLAGVYSFGRGLIRRQPLDGLNTTYKTLNRLHEDDFVVSQLKAWEGALTRIPADFDGWFLSPQFPTFRPVKSQLDVRYLDWFFKQPHTWELLRGRSRGMGARRDSVSPQAFLNSEIPLPPLAEQRRIVARLDELATRVRQVEQLRGEARICSQRLLQARFHQTIANAEWLPMAQVAPLERRSVHVVPDERYAELGVKSFGRGTFHKSEVLGFELGNKRVFRIEPGDLLFNIVFAWEGAVAVAQPLDSGRIGSHRFLTCLPESGVATAAFLRFYFLTASGLEQLGTASPGGAGRNRTLGLEALGRIRVPVPAYSQQLEFDELQGQSSAVASLQTAADEELSAFLSSSLARIFN